MLSPQYIPDSGGDSTVVVLTGCPEVKALAVGVGCGDPAAVAAVRALRSSS